MVTSLLRTLELHYERTWLTSFSFLFRKGCHDEKVKAMTATVLREAVMKAEMCKATCSWTIKAVDDKGFVFSKFPNIKKKNVQCNIMHYETTILFD